MAKKTPYNPVNKKVPHGNPGMTSRPNLSGPRSGALKRFAESRGTTMRVYDQYSTPVVPSKAIRAKGPKKPKLPRKPK